MCAGVTDQDEPNRMFSCPFDSEVHLETTSIIYESSIIPHEAAESYVSIYVTLKEKREHSRVLILKVLVGSNRGIPQPALLGFARRD
jgi:hypothetical protein